MPKRLSRWTCLGVLAVFNLVFWVGVAVGVGVLAGDTVDLGVETFVRSRQATAVVLWDQVSSEQPTAMPRPSPTAVAAARANPTETSAPTETALATQPPPTPALSWPKASGETETPPAETSQGPSLSPEPAEAASSQRMLSSPLLLSDPNLTSLTALDAEMRQSAPGRPVQIRCHQVPLNRELAALLSYYPDLPYEDLRVDLERGGLVLSGYVEVMGFRVRTEVQGTVTTHDCLPHAEVQSITIGSVMTPGFVREGIEELIAESLNWYPADYPLCLEQIVLEQDRLTVYGSKR